MADDANTIRRRTTCTPRNPSRAPARPPARIASLKIPRLAKRSCQVAAVSLTTSPLPVACLEFLRPASDEPGVDVLEVGRGPHRRRGGRERHAVIAIEEERVVGPLEAVLDQVGHHHDGGAPHLAKALDEIEHLLLGGGVERGGRLVEEDEIGVGRQRPRHEHALPLPARKIAKLPPLEGLDARFGEGGPRAPEVRARVRQRHVVGPLQAHEHEVEDRDREDGVEGGLLRNVSEAEARPAFDGAADGMGEPEGRADEGRLASAVGPDDGPQLPGAHGERERRQDRDAVVPDGERPRVQETLTGSERRRFWGRRTVRDETLKASRLQSSRAARAKRAAASVDSARLREKARRAEGRRPRPADVDPVTPTEERSWGRSPGRTPARARRPRTVPDEAPAPAEPRRSRHRSTSCRSSLRR